MSGWLVTGGAGYIGAHVVRALQDTGLAPVVLDDLSTGMARFVPPGVPFVEGTILDTALVESTLREHGCDGVIHVAGYKYAGVSVQRPLHTYEQNVTGTTSVLAAMERTGVDKLVFSSSAAVYGTPATEVVTEDSPNHPESPYGESKLIAEWLIRDVARAREDFRGVCLRYFNVVGSATDDADPAPGSPAGPETPVGSPSTRRRLVYDASPHNLFPLVIEALLAGRTPRINGDDYPTPDGTCVRDYVHVADLAASHVAAALALTEGRALRPAYNLGSGEGLSVRQIMDAMARVTGVAFTPEIAPRRPGDPARIVADGSAAAADLDWRMRYSLDEMVSSAWSARRSADSPVSAS